VLSGQKSQFSPKKYLLPSSYYFVFSEAAKVARIGVFVAFTPTKKGSTEWYYLY
jgi:hypothetical protein